MPFIVLLPCETGLIVKLQSHEKQKQNAETKCALQRMTSLLDNKLASGVVFFGFNTFP